MEANKGNVIEKYQLGATKIAINDLYINPLEEEEILKRIIQIILDAVKEDM